MADIVARWSLPVRRWAYRQTGAAASGKPDVGIVDPMLRRRLSPLARLALSAAAACGPLPHACRIVYASQHGEIQRTTQMLEALARGEPPSPTAFSLSVLNATPGVLSIARKDHSAINAITAGDDTLGYALLDAWTQLRETPASPVLLIHAFEAPPACYGPTARQVDDAGNALAILMESDAPARLTCTMHLPARRTAHAEPRSQSTSLVTSLLGGGSDRWRGECHDWQWEWQEDAQHARD
ncbi:hypothetical protein UC34_13640 [Pandoraea vervacti]|uniref:Beta-ketoacyl synthase-like N-terminal domain-containing protein n=1 Tax=Pandoraea vervacti TaxID=656178 RepID=A0ABN4FXM5_9BURK|nr:beta-ketoacyl synthase chain length factor [Pandoraea vervacti]AJP57742.1 hypothetical protein UC34_13640 [Pandoraea vervacti]